MRLRIASTWAGLALSSASLTGCLSSGANQSALRQNPTPLKPAATQAAAAPANGSAWARQSAPAATKPAGDPSALANPTGNTPQFNTQPPGGITPAGGLTPPMPVVPAAPTTGTSTSNLLPTGSSMNSLNAGTPVSALPVPARQVAVNAARLPDAGPRVSVPPPPPALDESPAQTIPPAPAASEVPTNTPPPIVTLSPAPTKVRQ